MNTNQPSNTALAAPILVIGGNGRTGKRIVQKLNELRIPIRVGSRNGDPAFDWTDRNTWAPALEGMKAVYISYQPDLAVEGATGDIQFLVELAVKAGIQKLVLLSGRGAYLFTEIFDGRNASLTDGVHQALNRQPADFSSFVQKNLASGIWS
jgi:nucleoside-diphosphate-sugar epimerase